MRLMLSIAAAFVVLAGCLWAAVNQPLALVSLVGAGVIVAYSYFMPKDRLVGWVASLAIVVVAVFPVHLVPSNIRYGELGMLALFTLLTLLHRGLKPLKGWVVALVLGYLGVTFLATRAAGIEEAPFQFLMHAIVGLAFLAFGASANKGERRTILGTVIVVGATEAAYALYEYAVRPAVLWASPVPEAWQWMDTRLANEILSGGLRSQGSFGHPLLLSFVMIVAMGLALRFPFNGRIMRPAIVGLLFVASVAAGSRSAALIMLALVLFSYGAGRFAWLRGIALTAVLGLLVLSSSFLSSDLVERFSGSGSLSHRQGALDAVPRLLSDQTSASVWFGNGYYSRQEVFDKGLLQLDGFVAIDNMYVALLVTTGLFGVLLWIIIPVLTYLNAGQALRPVVLASFGMFLAFDIFEFPATWGVFMLVLGLAATSVKEVRAPKAEAAPEINLKRLPEWAASNPQLIGSAQPRRPSASLRSPQAARG